MGKKDEAYELVKKIAEGKYWIVDYPLTEKCKAIVKGTK